MDVKTLIEKNKTWLLVFLCALPFFNDAYVPIQGFLDLFMDNAKTVVVVLLLFLYIKNKKKFSLLTIILFLMEIWWLISTLINYPIKGNDYVYFKLFFDIMSILAMGLIVEYFKDTPKDLIKGLMLNLELAIYPNFVTVLLKNIPGDRYYLIGFYAVLILWFMPAICVSTIYMIQNKKYIRGSLLIGISLLSAAIVRCATITVAFLGMFGTIMLGFILFKTNKFKDYKIPLSVLFVIAVLLNVFVLFVYSGGNYPIIDLFIEKFLNRSTTFTGRTPIWAEAIKMIKDKPIIGHGFRPEVPANWGTGYVIHAHNMFLQELNARGIIGLLIFVLFHIVLCIKVDKSKNTFARLVMVGACFGISLTYITEAYKKFFRLYLVFFIAYYIDDLIKDYTGIKKEKILLNNNEG